MCVVATVIVMLAVQCALAILFGHFIAAGKGGE